MTKRTGLFLVVCWFSLLLYGGQEGMQAVPAASQTDVKKLEQEIGRLRRQALEAEKKSAARSVKDRQKVVEENREAIAAAEKKLALKLEAIAREARNASDNQLRSQRTVWYIALGAVLIGMLSLILLLRGKSGSKGGGFSFADKKEREPTILIDPEIPDLKKFSLQNNGIQKISFILSLRDGQRFNCVAKLREGLDPLVYIEKDDEPVSWDKRRQRAAKISSSRPV